MLNDIVNITRIDRPIGILLLLWPTLGALFLGYEKIPPLSIIIIFCIGCILTRSAGCIINDIFDQDIDNEVSRTKLRPLADARLSSLQAILITTFLLTVCFTITLILPARILPFCILALFLITLYPLSKRFFIMPQLILGLTFAQGVVIAFATASTNFNFNFWLLFIATVIWALGYDTLYALVDLEDDKKLPIYSSAKTLKNYSTIFVTLMQNTVVLIHYYIAYINNFSMSCYLIISLAWIQFWIVQYPCLLSKSKELWFKGFLSNNWFGGLLFLGLAAGYI